MSKWLVQTPEIENRFLTFKERGTVAIGENMTAQEIYKVIADADMIKWCVCGAVKFKSATAREIRIVDATTCTVAILTRIGDPPPSSPSTDPGPTLAEMQARPAPQPAAPCCPTCHSTRLTKLSAGTRFIDRMFFGVFSPESRAQFRCMDCGYMF